MKDFKRSLKYLWPYRVRLGLAAGCVALIAVLWGGGLGAMLPGAKILISEEGLHGWAYGMLAEDVLNARLARRPLPTATRIEGRRLAVVLELVDVTEGGRAATAGLVRTEWIVGLAGEDPARRLMPADALSRALALAEPGSAATLRVYNQDTATVREVPITLGTARGLSRLVGRLIQRIPEPADRAGRMDMLLWLLGIVLAMTLLRDVLRFIQEYLVGSAVMRAMMDLRCDNYQVVLRLPTTFFSEQGVSDSMSRFVQDTHMLARGQETLFGKTLAEPAKAIASIVVAMVFCWQLALLALLAGPIVLILVRNFGRVMRKASRRALESWSDMLGVLNDTLTGIRIVKAYNMEGRQRRRFFQVNRRLLKQQRRVVRTDAAVSPSVEALGMVSAMIAVAVAGYWVLNRQYGMDGDKFLALMGCLAAMFDPVRKLARVATRFQRADAAAARIFELQDQPQQKRVAGAPMLPRHRRSIEFRDVRFRYPGAAEDALRDISLHIPAGETLAIVGGNGSGKTRWCLWCPGCWTRRPGRCGSTIGTSRRSPCGRFAGRSGWSRRRRCSSTPPSARTSPAGCGGRSPSGSSTPPARPSSTSSSATFPPATTRWSASTARR